ncbi:MAG TPA: TetR/AcrR family transcriptional regulator [Phycisphaerae bacterium]
MLDTAMRLFYEQGYHATGIATILREADVNSGSLYHFFPSKEALLIGVLERYVQGLHPMVIDRAAEATSDPVERVFALLRNYRRGLETTGCKMGCPIGNLALELSDDHPEIRRLIDLNFNNWIAAVKQWLDAAGDRLPSGIDRDELARFILTVMEGGIMQARAAASLAPFDASVRQLRAYFDRLLSEAARTTPTASHTDSTGESHAHV